jgi:hypothetical protein
VEDTQIAGKSLFEMTIIGETTDDAVEKHLIKVQKY